MRKKDINVKQDLVPIFLDDATFFVSVQEGAKLLAMDAHKRVNNNYFHHRSRRYSSPTLEKCPVCTRPARLRYRHLRDKSSGDSILQ